MRTRVSNDFVGCLEAEVLSATAPSKSPGATGRWRSSRRESAVAQLFSLASVAP